MSWRRLYGTLCAAMLSLGCATGPISLGDDVFPTCDPTQCGAEPSEPNMCSSGNAANVSCELTASDGCSWVSRCPEVVCAITDCGTAPAGNPMCPNDTWGAAWACETNIEGDCAWSPICPQDERQCDPDDCGTAPANAVDCSMLNMEGMSCLEDSDGSCQWTAVACRYDGN